MKRNDGRPLVRLNMPFPGAPLRVLRQRRRPQDVQYPRGDPQPRLLAEVRRLRPFVGDLRPAVPHPVVPQLEQPANLGVNVNVHQPLPHIRVLAQRLSPPVVVPAVVKNAIHNPVAPDFAAGAMLQLQVRGRHLPALVFAPNEVPGRHAHIVKIDNVLDAGTGARFARRRQQLHGEHADARQIRRHHKPAQIVMPLPLRVGAGNRPHIVGAVRAAHINFLPVDDIVIAVPPRRRLGVSQVGTRLRFGQQLPGADLAPENLRQKLLLLFLRTPHQNGIAPQPSPGIVVRRQRQVVPVNFLLQHHGVVHRQPAAAVLLRRGGPQPALLPQPAPQLPAQLVLLIGKIRRIGRMLNPPGDVLHQPSLHLRAKGFLLRRIARFKVHNNAPGKPPGRPPAPRAAGPAGRKGEWIQAQLCPIRRG